MLLSQAGTAAACAARRQCGSQAFSSGHQPAQPVCRGSTVPSRRQWQQCTEAQPQRRPWRCRAVPAEAAADVATTSSDDDEEYDPTTAIVVEAHNANPDFYDEHWADKVTDWYEFWHYQDWDQEDLVDEIDDEHDAVGAIEARRAQADPNLARLARATKMMEELASIQKYEQAIRVLGPVVKGDAHNAWEMQPVPAIIPDPNPPVNEFDLRAMVEKRKRRAMMDAEWQRRQALVGRCNSRINVDDVRLEGWIKDDWTDEQIRNLITGNGQYARPEDVLAYIDNPLLPADYPNTHGVEYVPDTVEFIESIGHLMTEEDMEVVDQEVVFEAQDFVDPSLIFRDEEGNLHMDAPINKWSAVERLQLAIDLEGYESDSDDDEFDDAVLGLEREQDEAELDEGAAPRAKKQKEPKAPPRKRGRKKKVTEDAAPDDQQ